MAMSGGVMWRRMHISRFLWLSGESWIEPQPGQTRLMDLGASRAVIWCWQRRRYRRDCWWATSSSGLRPVSWWILCARLRLIRPLLMEWRSNRGVWWVIDHVRAVYLKLDWFHEELRVNTWRKLPGHSQESNESTRNWNTVQVMTAPLWFFFARSCKHTRQCIFMITCWRFFMICQSPGNGCIYSMSLA